MSSATTFRHGGFLRLTASALVVAFVLTLLTLSSPVVWLWWVGAVAVIARSAWRTFIVRPAMRATAASFAAGEPGTGVDAQSASSVARYVPAILGIGGGVVMIIGGIVWNSSPYMDATVPISIVLWIIGALCIAIGGTRRRRGRTSASSSATAHRPDETSQ